MPRQAVLDAMVGRRLTGRLGKGKGKYVPFSFPKGSIVYGSPQTCASYIADRSPWRGRGSVGRLHRTPACVACTRMHPLPLFLPRFALKGPSLPIHLDKQSLSWLLPHGGYHSPSLVAAWKHAGRCSHGRDSIKSVLPLACQFQQWSLPIGLGCSGMFIVPRNPKSRFVFHHCYLRSYTIRQSQDASTTINFRFCYSLCRPRYSKLQHQMTMICRCLWAITDKGYSYTVFH